MTTGETVLEQGETVLQGRETAAQAVTTGTAGADDPWTIRVLDRGGEAHEIEWAADQSLMEALRDGDLPVLASCGGTASCATCHVFVAEGAVAELDERSEDELELLEETDAFDARTSRLSCQVPRSAVLVGTTVELAPEED